MEIPLKYKYRCSKPKGTFRADYNGNNAKRVHGVVPVGIRKRPKGKTRDKGLFSRV